MKRSTPSLRRRLHQLPRAEHVVLHRLARAQLHQRHVLVRGGVKDDVGRMPREHAGHPPGVADVAHQRPDIERRPAVLQLVGDGEQRVLVPLEQQQGLRLQRGDLAAQLRSDRPSRAGHHHAASGDQAARTGSGSSFTGGRTIRSSIARLRICATATLPLTISLSLGSVRDLHVERLQRVHHLSNHGGGAPTAWQSAHRPAWSARRCAARSARVPSTRTPCIRSPCLPGSSSTNPIGWWS